MSAPNQSASNQSASNQSASNQSDRDKALAKLESWSLRKLPPGKRWRSTGYFDVPGAVLRDLEREGLVESRKLSGHSPTEWRK